MKIPSKFPLLQKENALLILATKENAKIYLLQNGSLVESASVHLAFPKNFEREGRFEEYSPHGELMSLGSAYKNKKAYAMNKFLSSFSRRIKNIKGPYDEICLFCSARMHNHIKQILPAKLKSKVTYEFVGNFIKHKPTELLKMIRTRRILGA